MIDILEETHLKIKTPGLSYPETYVLTYNKYNTYKVLIFSHLNKAQIQKTPHTQAPIHETEILMSFNCLIVFEPNNDVEFFHFKKPNKNNSIRN